jgi:hypothetical protein
MSPQFADTNQIRRDAAGAYEFSSEAAEITILNRQGVPIWKMRKSSQAEPIRWNGRDIWGNTIGVGTFICKIIFGDGKSVYVPFVHMA